jgi:threonine dehydrogenase-like Zn-dependent dehydrogenase
VATEVSKTYGIKKGEITGQKVGNVKVKGNNIKTVKVIYTGMCHSEFYPWTVAKKGDVFGHETVGIIEKIGKNVAGFSVGDRVTGLGGGGYKEYIVMEPQKAVKVPENLATEDAIAEPLACIMSVAERIDSGKIGDRIAVVGCGYMGLGLISLLKARGYADSIAVDKRPIALENAKKFGATETYLPEELPENYKLNWDNWSKPDLTRDGHKTDIFHTGLQTVVEFTGTEDGLALAADMVCAHGTLGIAGYHNDGVRTLDFKLINMKAVNIQNCHERRIEYEATLAARALKLLASGQWRFTGVTNHIYSAQEFDRANMDMDSHRDNFIKGAVKFI